MRGMKIKLRHSKTVTIEVSRRKRREVFEMGMIRAINHI